MIGDRINVIIHHIDMDKRQIDLRLAPDNGQDMLDDEH